MKSFKNFITEKKARNFGTKGGDGGVKGTRITPEDRSRASANKQDPSRAQSGGKPKTFTTRPGISYTTNAPSGTVLGGKTPEQADQELTTKQKQRGTQPSSAKTQRDIKGFGKDIQTTGETKSGGRTASPSKPYGDTAKSGDVGSFIRGEQSKGRPVSDTMQDVAGRKGAGYDFPKDAGTEKPRRTKPGSYVVQNKGRRATRILGAAEGQAAKPTGSLRSGNLSFPGDRSGAYTAAKAKVKDAPLSRRGMRAPGGVSSAKPAPAKPAPVKQSEVSKTIKQRLLSLKSTRESKPTAAQLKQFRLGQTKGYIGKTGTPTAQGIQTYTTRRATKGFGDVGYDPAKRGVKDPLAVKRNVDNIVSRAAAGDKLARREVKKSYKAMTRRYKDIVPSARRTQAGMASVKSGLENTSATRPPSATPPPKPPKLDDTPKSSRLPAGRSKGGGTSTGGSRGGAAVLTPTKPPKTVTKIAAPPTPKTQTPKPPTGPKVTSNTGGKLADTIAPNIIDKLRNPKKTPKPQTPKPQTPKPQTPKPQTPKPTSQGQTATFGDIRRDSAFQTSRKGSYTYKPAVGTAAKVKSALGRAARGAGRALGPAAAIADVGLTYKDARDAGYTKGQSVKRTAAQVGSGSVGGWAGAKAGALTGAKIGAFLGPKGAAIGAGIGGIVGGIGGYMAGRGLATKVLNQTMKPKEYRPKVNQQQVQNTANNIKNKPTTPTLAPKVNPTTGQRYVDDKTIKKFGLKTAAELNKVKKPKPTTKNLSIPLNASFSPLEEYILETSDAMLKSGYSIDETVDFWTIEDEDLVEKVLSSLTLTESVSFDDDLYVVCERVGALKSLGSWALRQAGKLKGAFSRGGGSTVNVTRSQTRGGIFNTGILKKWFKPKVQVTGRGIQKPPKRLGRAGKLGALGLLGLGTGIAVKNILDAEKAAKDAANQSPFEIDPTRKPKEGPNPNTPTAQGWWKKLHHNKPVVQIPYKRPDDPTRPDR